jgi:signal peptidase I
MNALDVRQGTSWGLDTPLRPLTLVDTSVPPGGAGDDRWKAAHRRPERPAGKRVTRVLTETALTVGALLGVLIAGVTATAAHYGIRPLVVRSGSMEPTISTGSLVLVKRVDAADIKVGNVVTAVRPDNTRVTHRVVAVERNGMTAVLTLKGDANEDPDPFPVPVRNAYRVVFQLPVIGRTVAWLATAPGGFLLGCLSTLVAGHILRLRRSAAGRLTAFGSVVRRSGVAAPEQFDLVDEPDRLARPFVSWVGIVIEERLGHRRSQPASPGGDRRARHAA